jgi:hypothetical protein
VRGVRDGCSSLGQGEELGDGALPFTQELSIAYERTHYGTSYFIHHQFPDGPENLSQLLGVGRANGFP